MKIAVVLISRDGYYLGENGELPFRPSFDKELITFLATDKVVLCSENTEKTIPPSIRKVAKAITTDPTDDWDTNFGINTFSEDSDYFVVVNSISDLGGGKEFKLSRITDKYTLAVQFGPVDIYRKNKVTEV